MKALILSILLVLGSWGGLTRIRDRNAAIGQGAAAYARGDFRRAALAYRRAVEQLGTRDEAVLLNLAHACARAGQAADARTYYGRLLSSRQAPTRSIARQQLAVLAARQGDYAQAVSLLRKALLANPANAEARYNYETLKAYLDRRHDEPRLPPPADEAPGKSEKRPTDPQQPGRQPRPQPGADQQGQRDDPAQPQDPQNAPQSRPGQNGPRDPNRPDTNAGSGAKGGFQPGSGTPQPLARGQQPGAVRGLSDEAAGTEAERGRSRRAGSEPAALDENQLQTQRERLQQMNLSSGQAHQLLDALNAAEQQYLQQLPHQPARKPESGKPAW